MKDNGDGEGNAEAEKGDESKQLPVILLEETEITRQEKVKLKELSNNYISKHSRTNMISAESRSF